jgi:Ca2+-transporting ATPase
LLQRAPRSRDEGLVSGWLFVRYSVIGAYVGVATVAAFGIWYLFPSFLGIDLTGDGHTIISFGQLSSWGTCPAWPDFHPAPYTAGPLTIAMENPCDYFTTGKVRLGAVRSWQLNLAESRATAWVVESLWEMQRHECRVMI